MMIRKDDQGWDRRPSLLRTAGAWSVLVLLGCSSRPAPPSETVRTFDAGPIVDNTQATIVHTFPVHNHTNRRVTVTGLTKACSCRSVSIDRDHIEPGATAELKMVVDANTLFTDASVACHVDTDEPLLPDLTYVVFYRTYPAVRFEDAGIQLGEYRPTDHAAPAPREEVTIEVYETVGDGPADRLDTIDAPAPLTVEFRPDPVVDLIEDGKVRRSRYQAAVGLTRGPDPESGTKVGWIKATTSRGKFTMTPVSWTVTSAMSVVPSRLSFSSAGDEGKPRKVVKVDSKDDRPFRLLGLGTSDGEVECAGLPSPTASTSQQVEITLLERPVRKFMSGRVVLLTDDPEVPEIELPWSAIFPRSSGPTNEGPPSGPAKQDGP